MVQGCHMLKHIEIYNCRLVELEDVTFVKVLFRFTVFLDVCALCGKRNPVVFPGALYLVRTKCVSCNHELLRTIDCAFHKKYDPA